MPESLPPYSGDVAVCAKCLSADVGVRYVSERVEFPLAGNFHPTLVGPEQPEHMLRSCRRCGYQWQESCADVCGSWSGDAVCKLPANHTGNHWSLVPRVDDDSWTEETS